MKMFYRVLFVAASLTIVLACSENQFSEDTMPLKSPTSARLGEGGAEDRCATMKVLEAKLAEDPGLAQAMDAIESQTQRIMDLQKLGKPGSTDDGGTTDPSFTIKIPVYVHVVYNTSDQNISNAQIRSQITVLNKDFRARNQDRHNAPDEFKGLIDDFNIHFTWNNDNLIRKSSTRESWGTKDDVKFSKRGGSSAVPGYLNIWVCNIGDGILGYAQFPGGPAKTDGIVVGPEFFGSSALASGYFAAPYDLGRTATHEVGHWLNLRHIWGDGGCRVDDRVADTPGSNGPNFGCPAYPTVRCGNNNMTMNYMDYTDDSCMYMFTTGQKARSRALFAPGGPRANFVPAS